MKRFANRKDLNQPEIVKAIEAVGASVEVMDYPADLLVGIPCDPPVTLLVEIKQARKRGWKDEKTAKQKKFAARWRGQYAIIYTVDEALELIAEYRLKGNLQRLQQSDSRSPGTDQLNKEPSRDQIANNPALGVGHVKSNGQAPG